MMSIFQNKGRSSGPPSQAVLVFTVLCSIFIRLSLITLGVLREEIVPVVMYFSEKETRTN